MANSAVHLTTPPDAALIEAGDRTVLAATPYRHGRVVLASFGQWFHPEPGRPTWKLTRRGGHWTRQIPPDQRPVESGRGLHIPLLRNVMAWLDEPHNRGELAQLRQPFVDAHRAGLLDQFRVKPRAELAGAMEDLIGSVPDGMWKEEALWVAGESLLQLFYFQKSRHHPGYGWPTGRPPQPEPRYFQQLVAEFPDSTLRPFARWRLADCRRNCCVRNGRFQMIQRHIGGLQSKHFSKSTLRKAAMPGLGLNCASVRYSSGTVISAPHCHTIAMLRSAWQTVRRNRLH